MLCNVNNPQWVGQHYIISECDGGASDEIHRISIGRRSRRKLQASTRDAGQPGKILVLK